MNCRKHTKFFNSGFLPSNSNNLRLQQGLQSQEYANVCAYKNISSTSPIVAESSGLAGNPIQRFPTPITYIPIYNNAIPSSY